MKKNLAVAVFCIGIGIFLVAFSPGMAENAETVRFVSPDGSDAGPGTSEEPWRTIRHAVDQARPGMVIRLTPGVFRERVVITRSGEEGRPVTIEGARGPGGERLTRIDAGIEVPPETWEPAPGAGPNVYRNTALPFEPGLVTIAGRFIARAHRANDGSQYPYATPGEIMAWPEDHVLERDEVEFSFWDAMGAVFTCDPKNPSTLFLRIAESRSPADPRQRDDIAVSPGGGVISIENASHIVIRGVEITRGEIGVNVSGNGARDNLVDDCLIMHGRQRVRITAGARGTVVRNSRLAMGFFGAQTGAWAGGKDVESVIKRHLYTYFKYMHGPGSISDDRAVMVDGRALDTVIENSHLDGGLVGIQSSFNRGLVVRGNRIKDFSSVGLALRDGTLDALVHDNLVSNSSINIRIHRLNAPGGGHRAHIYRNTLFQPGEVGQHIFSHVLAGIEEYPEPEFAFYHNTFAGGARGWWMPHARNMPRGVPGVRFINNIFACNHPFRGHVPLYENPEAVGAFDYNWLGGQLYGRFPPAWFGENNIVAEEKDWLWTEGVMPDFRLPEGHPAREAGIDLSRPFVIGGKTHEPLPGMEPGYFPGDRPDMGAVQHR